MSKKIFVTQPSMPSMDEYIEEIKEIWESHWLTNMGPKHQQFQTMLMDYLGVQCVELLTNGHMALEMVIQAMNFPEGGEVITTPFTFASTVHAIVRNRLRPVLCDINPENYTIDADKIEEKITNKTCAILPVHVYGNICDVEKIETIAQKYGLKVIYDAAHAFGETYKGIGIGNFGDASCFSFHATKVFNSIEGGAVCFRDRKLGNSLYDLKNFGIHGPEAVTAVGANAKMNEFCAAMGICNLRHVDDEIAKRQIIVRRYNDRLAGIPGLKLNLEQMNVKCNYAYYPVVFEPRQFGKNRDEIFKRLGENGINARKYFYPCVSMYECYAEQYNISETPIAFDISRKILTLPLYADLALEDVDKICDIIIEMK